MKILLHGKGGQVGWAPQRALAPLNELIEVQSGAYLGGDDIVRFEDTYGRLSPNVEAKP